RQQPLDVVLQQRQHVAQRHRDGGQDPQQHRHLLAEQLARPGVALQDEYRVLAAELLDAQLDEPQHAHQGREAGDLRHERQQRRHAGRSALVNVGGVEVERHRGDAETQPGDHHDERHQRQAAERLFVGGEGVGHRRQVGGAGHAVEVAEAEQQERRREDAEQKVLHRRLLRRRVGARQVQHDVGRDADEFQREEQWDEVVGGGGESDAGGNEQDAGVVLGGVLVASLVPAEEDEDQPAAHGDDADEEREPVQHERPGEQGGLGGVGGGILRRSEVVERDAGG